MSVELLVRGRWVVTGAAADDPCLSDAGIAVEDGRIVALGDWAEIRQSHPDAEVVGSERMAVLPV